MKGRHHILVQNRYLKYEFDIVRNLTIIQGDSASGKTTLIDMIREAVNGGRSSGIQISCDVACRVLEGDLWHGMLSMIENTILFIDEGNEFVESEEFAEAVNGSSNYYVIVTRENLDMLPISVTEVYGIHSSGKYGDIRPVYHHLFHIYETDLRQLPVIPEEIITEDSNSRFEFFSDIAKKNGIKCVSAGGKTNIYDVLIKEKKILNDILIIADGAAFASQMNRILKLVTGSPGIQLYLPESFEWLILASGVLNDSEIKALIDTPENFIESSDFVSWERFFTSVLVQYSERTYLQYSKRKLNPHYLDKRIQERILDVMKGIDFKRV